MQYLKLYAKLFLWLSLSLLTAAEISLPGPRHIKAVISQSAVCWNIKLSMLPVSCFTDSTNKQVTKKLAKLYALTALALHQKKEALSADEATYQEENFSPSCFSVVVKIPLSSVREVSVQTEISKQDKAAQLSVNLLSREEDWRQIILSLSQHEEENILRLKNTLGSLNSESRDMRIAEQEEKIISDYAEIQNKFQQIGFF